MRKPSERLSNEELIRNKFILVESIIKSLDILISLWQNQN